jgi:hypothetical protein
LRKSFSGENAANANRFCIWGERIVSFVFNRNKKVEETYQIAEGKHSNKVEDELSDVCLLLDDFETFFEYVHDEVRIATVVEVRSKLDEPVSESNSFVLHLLNLCNAAAKTKSADIEVMQLKIRVLEHLFNLSGFGRWGHELLESFFWDFDHLLAGSLLVRLGGNRGVALLGLANFATFGRDRVNEFYSDISLTIKSLCNELDQVYENKEEEMEYLFSIRESVRKFNSIKAKTLQELAFKRVFIDQIFLFEEGMDGVPEFLRSFFQEFESICKSEALKTPASLAP